MLKPAGWQNEISLWEKGFKAVVGIDEVGRGAWAGPVVSAAVVFPQFISLEKELFDSKLLRHGQRSSLVKIIKEKALAVGVGVVEVSYINRFGIVAATQKSYRKAIENLGLTPDFYLIDAFYLKGFSKKRQLPIIHGDAICASIAAASIVAKVHRDSILRKLHRLYPSYGFGRHKGYGTKEHQNAIRQFQLSEIHRINYNLTPFLSS